MSTKRKASARFAPPTVKSSIKVPTKSKIDETRTSVSGAESLHSDLKQTLSSQADAIEISSDEASDSDEDSDEAMNGVETTAAAATKEAPPKANGAPQADASPEEDSDGASPSFGELLRGTIDVPALLSQHPDGTSGTLTKTASTLAPPSLDSLGTVLAQALRTEDTELLESCLQVTAADSIQQTVSRLDSALAGVLLTKLAARFHRRPGRAGSLMAWVKWTLVAHGGALAVQPGVLDRLASLQRVLNERSRGLPGLLALKGKLDMLDAQMQMRAARQRRDADDAESSDEDEDAIYVEGEEAHTADAGGSEDEIDDEVALATNGFVADSDVDDDEEDVEEIEDSEAEEDLDEDDVDHDDLEDSASDDDSDAEAAPPTKVQKTARTFGKRR